MFENVQSFKSFTLHNDLQKALEEGQLSLQYMPRVNTESTQIVGVEALLRWNHPDWGLVPPAEFIPIAEETGLIVPIGEWVLREACEQNKYWTDSGFVPITVSINYSAQQLLNHDMLETIDQILQETGLSPEQLEIELTEETLTSHELEIGQLLLEIANRHIKVSIDDFGNGYSSLNTLKQFNVKTLKIDKLLIQDVPAHLASNSMIENIINIAHELEMKVVAEGVETIDQYMFMKAQKCEEIQGYYFSRPIDVEELNPLLEAKYLINLCSISYKADPPENRRNTFRVFLDSPLSATMTITKFRGKEVDLGDSKVWITNIGPGGLRFTMGTKIPARDDTILKFTMELLDFTYELHGNIVWINDDTVGNIYEYGVRFMMDEKEREKWISKLILFAIKQREGHPPQSK